jgi:hypothetical protein
VAQHLSHKILGGPIFCLLLPFSAQFLIIEELSLYTFKPVYQNWAVNAKKLLFVSDLSTKFWNLFSVLQYYTIKLHVNGIAFSFSLKKQKIIAL